MTHRLDVACRHDLVVRWCVFAERRLQYLTEMFESGRWRRYYSELAFLDDIQEAKNAAETWRVLAGHSSARKDQAAALLPRERGVEPVRLASTAPTEVSLAETGFVSAAEMPSAPVDLVALEQALNDLPPALDLAAMERRYPLLRNAL